MKKIKVGLLVEEFYDKDLGGYGGYGILAREYISRYIPNHEIEIEVIIGHSKNKKEKVIEKDGIKINYLPKNSSSKLGLDLIYNYLMRRFFERKKFDIYLSIEMSRIAYEVMKFEKDKKLILWIQDPRPKSDWEEIKTVSQSNEYESYLNYYKKWENKIQILLKKLLIENRLILISQGRYLKKKAIELYKFPKDVKIKYFPNPVEVKNNFSIKEKKESILFLGRLSVVKRPWIYFELAKYFPQYTFYVCGENRESKELVKKYKNQENLRFMGHITGMEKDQILRECKILINTSIHEAIPVSFLEAISYGLKIVSCQNPDNITSNNGYYTGKILGDGYSDIEKFKYGIEVCMDNYIEEEIEEAIRRVEMNHNKMDFITNMRKLVVGEILYE